MNTIEVGDAFENRSFDAIRIGIREGLLGIPYDDARPFQKKGYFSKKRGKDIIIDLSVELWPPNATRPSILYLIECKDHAADISVGKIEEFAGKVSQIADGGFFVKGVFISGTSFQLSRF